MSFEVVVAQQLSQYNVESPETVTEFIVMLLKNEKTFEQIECELLAFDIPPIFISWLQSYISTTQRPLTVMDMDIDQVRAKANNNLFLAAIQQTRQPSRVRQKQDVRMSEFKIVPASNSNSGVLMRVEPMPSAPRVMQVESGRGDVFSRLGKKSSASPYEKSVPTAVQYTKREERRPSPTTHFNPDFRPTVTPVIPLVPATTVAPVEICKFGLRCTRADCFFTHPSPASFASSQTYPQQAYPHQSYPHQSHSQQQRAPPVCKFFPNCRNTSCSFTHPKNRALTLNVSSIPCKFASVCKNTSCQYLHASVHATSQRVFALDEADAMEMDAGTSGETFAVAMSGLKRM